MMATIFKFAELSSPCQLSDLTEFLKKKRWLALRSEANYNSLFVF